VDLSPLRKLAVQHDGRVKIIDTLARETVARITGRKNYQDFVPQPDGKIKKVGYDPLFTFFDMMIDPVYYADKPLMHVEYLPLRRAFVDAAFPSAKSESPADAAKREAEQDKWMKLTRLSPMMVMRHGPDLQDKYDTQLPYHQAFSELAQGINLFQSGSANLLMVAPAQRQAEYTHISSLPEDSPVRRAAAEMGKAWRAGDAAGVNRAVLTLAEELPKINAGVYPTFKRNIEYAYNRSNAFEWGYWAYALSLLTLLLAFGTARKWLIALGVTLLFLSVGLHAFGFITRCLIAERFAIQNQYESMTGLSLFGTLVGLTIMLLRRQWLFGAAAAGVGFLVLITATQAQIPGRFIEREAAILNTSVLLKYHVTTVLCSYGLISLGFIVSLFYLGTYYGAKLKGRAAAARAAVYGQPAIAGGPDSLAVTALNLDDDQPHGLARTLSDLDKAQMTVLQLAFWGLGVGILLGAWWADHSWGRWWAFDPKETWALVTWIIYLVVIHVRLMTGHNRGLVTAWLSVLGFVTMLWTYFGVNLILPGLHAYA
jgi:cytochrome c-type biogenesis protein CcsB